MKRLRCVIMRGGTSKGVFFHENELPQDPDRRREVILRVFGSPDRRQIDGLGGADILTSKVAIIGPPSRRDADVDYIFGQVGITEPVIDFGTICGNLSAAVGPFAIDEGLVRAKEPFTQVRIFCPMVGRYLMAEVEVRDGKAVYEGTFRIDGVPGTGSRISLDFADTAGLITGELLPTGRAKDTLYVEGVGRIEVSVVDAATVVAFVRAADLGLRGAETPDEIEADRTLMEGLERIKRQVAQLADLTQRSPLLPMVAMVQEPVQWKTFATEEIVRAEQVDVLSKVYAAGMMHKAYPVTGCVATGAAAMIEGTIVNEILSERWKGREELVIGHFSGMIPIEVAGEGKGPEFSLRKAVVYRTARRIMEGWVYV